MRKTFISYSREGGQAHAVSLYQGLVQVLGEKAVFLDVGRDAMETGRSWKESVREALAGCDTVLLVLDPGMAVRLAEPESAVLFELETALEYGMTIACVRVDGAAVPHSTALPQSLRDLSDGHSPEIHSDAVVADIERVIKDLTGRVPGQVSVIDRWDLTVLGVLGALGLVAWFSSWRSLLNLHETWLWGGALFIPWLIWMSGRRVLATGSRGRASLSYRQAGSWLAVLIVFGSGLLLAGRFIYGVPELPAESGILVARLKGDPSDSYQMDLVGRFPGPTDDIVRSGGLHNVAPLPRRISFSPFNRSDNGHKKAYNLGTSARAAVVLWGSVLPPQGAESARLEVSLTFIRSEGFYKVSGSELVGAMESSDLNDLNGDLALLADTLPDFLNSYSTYHSATSEDALVQLADDFSGIIEYLENRSTEDDRDRDALNEILASVHFYRGNTLLALDRKQEAVSAYEAAVDQAAKTERVVGGGYIEAANNLGWLLKAKGDASRAYEILTAANGTCSREDVGQHRACAYVSYNLGNLQSDQDLYVDAEANFSRAIVLIQPFDDPPDTTDLRFYASSHQYLAYSLLRQAATTDARHAATLLKKAEEGMNRGMDALEKAALDVPEYHHVTLARIYIEGGKWNEAIELLTEIDVLTSPDAPEKRRANVHTLLGGAYWCVGDIEEALQHMRALEASGDADQPDDDYRDMNTEALVEVARIQAMCPETE